MTATPAGMTYADYLHLDALLDAQRPLSDLHDEMLFIVIHQTKELWLKQMLHEVALACRLVAEDQFAEAYKALSRVSRIQSVMTLSWDVLATLTPVDYSRLSRRARHARRASSRRSSASSNIGSGIKDPKFLEYYEGGSAGHARLRSALDEPSLWDAAHAALARAGFGSATPSVAASWLAVYRDAERWFELYQLAEKLVDVDDALAAWRHKHVLTVERIIGMQVGHRRLGRGGVSALDARQARLSRTVVAQDRALSFKPCFRAVARRRAGAAALGRAQPSFVARRQLRRPA